MCYYFFERTLSYAMMIIIKSAKVFSKWFLNFHVMYIKYIVGYWIWIRHCMENCYKVTLLKLRMKRIFYVLTRFLLSLHINFAYFNLSESFHQFFFNSLNFHWHKSTILVLAWITPLSLLIKSSRMEMLFSMRDFILIK